VAPSLGIKRPGREADHSLPSIAEVKDVWRYTSTPQYAFMAWYLVKHRDNFTFTFVEIVNIDDVSEELAASFCSVQETESYRSERCKCNCGAW
jgi:hypothetical protein